MTAAAKQIVSAFEPGTDGAAAKSRDLILDLLNHTAQPFSRDQFEPGHITCTALVRHPHSDAVLFMHHHRLHRWLLPGGHVEPEDASLSAAAAREAVEETFVQLDPAVETFLASVDVHGIPPKKQEPFHLHHDLIWCFRAASQRIETTEEAPQVLWASETDWDRLEVAESIRQCVRRISGRALS